MNLRSVTMQSGSVRAVRKSGADPPDSPFSFAATRLPALPAPARDRKVPHEDSSTVGQRSPNLIEPGTTAPEFRLRRTPDQVIALRELRDAPVNPRDHRQGPDTARVTLVEYGDYECQWCGQAYIVVKEIQQQLGDRLRFVFRNFPQTRVHLHAQNAAEAAEAAGGQHKFWEMHDSLFEHQIRLSDKHVRSYASQLGLDMARFKQDMVGHTYAPRVTEDILSGVRSGVSGTPTIFINEVRHLGALDAHSLLMAIESTA